MEKNNGTGNGRDVDRTLAAMEEMELYCLEHPWSPAAVRRPGLSIRGRTVVALLGPAIEEGIAGFGDSVHAALHAFNAQYLRSLRKPEMQAVLTAPSPSASSKQYRALL